MRKGERGRERERERERERLRTAGVEKLKMTWIVFNKRVFLSVCLSKVFFSFLSTKSVLKVVSVFLTSALRESKRATV